MTKNRTADPVSDLPATQPAARALSLDAAAKGSSRSMWELLLQLRVLLPYLARLAPLLDRSLGKNSPDFGDLRKEIIQVQTGTRDLEVQARNQALQMERIEQQVDRWRAVQQETLEQTQKLTAELGSFRRRLTALASAVLVLLLACTVMMIVLVCRQ